MAIGHQSFYQTQLTSAISDTDLIIPLDTVPTVSEGFLVIESTVEAKREIIYYTSKDASSVTCPSGAGNGRGYDGTTAVSHLQGATVIMAPVGVMFDKLGDISVNSITIGSTTSAVGWSPLGATPSTITNNGNHSTDLTFTGVDLTPTLSEGMRLRATRTVAAPIQCATFDGTNDYFSKSSPAGMTFTDDFVVSAWVKMTSYAASAIISRYNGTSGWTLETTASGQIYLSGFNSGASNVKYVNSYQSLPLNKWVHITAQLDMSAISGTNTGLGATTNYMMFDGVDIPVGSAQSGTNPSALIQAGNLEVGSKNGGTTPFPGKISQVAIYSAKVTQATIKASMNQGLTGSETSLVSAYSLSNSLEDLSANNNDLTANGGVLATTADSPFGNSGASATLEYAIVMSKPVYSGGDTTMTVQTPEGCAIPTSGGISSVDYSSASVPFGFPRDSGKWELELHSRVDLLTVSPTIDTWYNPNTTKLPVTTGSWDLSCSLVLYGYKTGSAAFTMLSALSSSTSSISEPKLSTYAGGALDPTNTTVLCPVFRSSRISVTTTTPYYLIFRTPFSSVSAIGTLVGSSGNTTPAVIIARNAYL